MTAEEFRQLALSLPEATEQSHMRHPDFRVHGKIFATLGYPDDARAMVKLLHEQQAALTRARPDVFSAVPGSWGRRGATYVALDAADKAVAFDALLMAWTNTIEATVPEGHGATRRVQRALAAAGIATVVRELPQSTRTAADAAAAVGCRVAQIVKSLVFRVGDSGPALLVLASGSNRVDVALVASEVGAAVTKPDADFVRSTTGFAIGGVPPLGHRQPLLTLVDQDLLQFDTVWAAGGTPHAVFALTPAELVQATGGRVVAMAERARRP